MRTRLWLALSFALLSCTGREARGKPRRPAPAPLSAQEILAAFEQTVDRPTDLPREGDVADVHPTLFEAVAQGSCQREAKDCEVLVVNRLLVKGGDVQLPDWPELEPIEEVVLVGLGLERRCEWSLAARSRAGWLDPIGLGTSAAGCQTPLDDGAIESSNGLWFPLAFTADGAALRVEAQAFGHSEGLTTVWDEPKTRVTVTRRREVLLCKLHPLGRGGLVCATESEAAQPISGDAKTLFGAKPLAAGSTVLPLSDASRVSSLPASWILAPPPGPKSPMPLREVLSSYRQAQLELHTLGADGPTVVLERLEPTLLILERGKTRWVSSHLPDYANESFEITRTESSPGLMRVDFERIIDGPTRVTWRFTELVTASHHVRLATGVEISAEGKTVRSWSRKLEADRHGVKLIAGHGELAWFRGTGRFTYPELEKATGRWRLGFASAWSAVADEPTRFPDKAESEFKKEGVGRLVTIPGYAEPTNWTILDEVRRLTP